MSHPKCFRSVLTTAPQMIATTTFDRRLKHGSIGDKPVNNPHCHITGSISDGDLTIKVGINGTVTDIGAVTAAGTTNFAANVKAAVEAATQLSRLLLVVRPWLLAISRNDWRCFR